MKYPVLDIEKLQDNTFVMFVERVVGLREYTLEKLGYLKVMIRPVLRQVIVISQDYLFQVLFCNHFLLFWYMSCD